MAKKKQSLAVRTFENIMFTLIKWENAIEELKSYPLEKGTYPSFRKELKRLGFRVFKYVEQDYFCQLYPEKTRKTVLKYYNLAENINEKQFYLSCLLSPKNSDLFDFFYKEYEKYTDLFIEREYFIKCLLDCIYATRDIKWKEEYVNGVWEFIFKEEIWPFIMACGEYNLEEAMTESVIREIKIDDYFLHDIACIALKKYKNQKINFLRDCEKNYDFYITDITNKMFEDKLIYFNEDKKFSNISKFKVSLNILLDTENDIIQFCHDNVLKIKDTILEFYQNAILLSDKCFYIKCLTTEKNYDLFPFLIEELRIWKRKKIDAGIMCNSLASSIYSTRNIKNKDLYMKMIYNDKFVNYNSLILLTCGKLQIKEIIPYLLKVLEDERNPLCIQAMQALICYRNKEEYKDIFTKYSKSNIQDMRNFANKALRSIAKK